MREVTYVGLARARTLRCGNEGRQDHLGNVMESLEKSHDLAICLKE